MKLLAWCVGLVACSMRPFPAEAEAYLGMEADFDASVKELTTLVDQIEHPASSVAPREEPRAALATGLLSLCVMTVSLCQISGIITSVSEDCWQKKKATCDLAPSTYRVALIATFLSALADSLFAATVIFKGKSVFAKAFLSTAVLGKVMLALAMAIVFYPAAGADTSTSGLLARLWAWAALLVLLGGVLIGTPVVECCQLPAEQPAVSSASA